eukprot:TRINITY_DN19850_c0_g4_i1.p1 TRINITY_DN19850_c0_g4~~TRINITY_DN19850_c0_g4_i1.p1  ORF type:complete len:630 (+),score=190.93 TRINITY_DN19850_c0_g4_i1:152-2041(+)
MPARIMSMESHADAGPRIMHMESYAEPGPRLMRMDTHHTETHEAGPRLTRMDTAYPDADFGLSDAQLEAVVQAVSWNSSKVRKMTADGASDSSASSDSEFGLSERQLRSVTQDLNETSVDADASMHPDPHAPKRRSGGRSGSEAATPEAKPGDGASDAQGLSVRQTRQLKRVLQRVRIRATEADSRHGHEEDTERERFMTAASVATPSSGRLQRRNQELEQEVADLRQKLEQLEERSQRLREELDQAAESQVEDQIQATERHRRASRLLEKDREELKEQLAQAQTLQANNADAESRWQSVCSALTQKSNALEEQCEALLLDRAELGSERDRLQVSLEALRSTAKRQEKAASPETAAELAAMQQEMGRLLEEIATFEKERAGARAELEEVFGKLREKESNELRLEREARTTRKELEERTQELIDRSMEVATLQERLEEASQPSRGQKMSLTDATATSPSRKGSSSGGFSSLADELGQAAEQASAEATDWRSRCQEALAKIDSLERVVEKLQDERAEIERQRQALRAEVEALQERLREMGQKAESEAQKASLTAGPLASPLLPADNGEASMASSSSKPVSRVTMEPMEVEAALTRSYEALTERRLCQCICASLRFCVFRKPGDVDADAMRR